MTRMITRLGDKELARLIEHGEDQQIEFKETLAGNSPNSIREAVCAFSNDLHDTRSAGVVVIGLKDDGTPCGHDVTDEMLRNLTDIRSDGNILPPPVLLVEKRSYKEVEVAVVTVSPSDSPPVRYKGKICVRVGPRKGVATAQEERILNERRRSGDRPFDISPIPGTADTELDQRRFENEYLPNAVDRAILEANDRSHLERLAATKMIASVDDPRTTLLGLLIIGRRPRDFIPGAYIQFLRISGREMSDAIIDAEELDGTIPDMLRRLDDKLQSHNRRQIDLVSGEREQQTESYPLVSLREFSRNAVMHRTYEKTNAPVRITWFDDRIEIQNPGGPFGAVTEVNFGQAGYTDYRNPNLAEAMKVLGYVQRFGVGIQIAQRYLQKAGHPVATFTTESMNVLTVVRSTPAVSETLS